MAAEPLMTAEEFGRRADPGHPEELARGRIVRIPIPDQRHSYFCSSIGHVLAEFVHEHDLGRVMSNGSGVITRRNPDSVRGADIAYYSYDRLPRGPLPAGYGRELPELVVEVRSESDRWLDVLRKVSEYLNAGVLAVIVLDPGPQVAHVFGADDAPSTLGPMEELVLPCILEGFGIRVGRFFE
jgi:Uma2 family endonuclease